ncbi:unnamed protein product, partial [Mesorhabditis belari]|uniref:Olfactomedin-like domain-containing protein n=1 Tax=Mesorhabditis belari TaxID=2138241 RepID=A0AAF3ETH6_9BILA
MISSRLFLGFSLIFALMMIVYQRMSIVNLQKSLDETPRGRRSLYSSENEIRDDYLPIYAEMTKSQLKHLCEKHSITIGFEAKKHRKKSHSDRKHCQVDVSMTAPRLVTKRPHSIGAALRDGKYWFVFEYHLGYTLLVYHNESALVDSMPSKIFTLPYPFHGTDATVHNRTVVYLFGESLIAHHLETKTTRHHAINASHDPLYGGSTSRIDAGADEHGLWIKMDASDWCNSFVRCGTLFSVKCIENSTISIEPIFDFYKNRLMSDGRKYTWQVDHETKAGLGSAQFDPHSRTLNIFAQGHVFSSQFGR